MTDEEKKRLKTIIVTTGMLFGKEYTDETLLMIVEDLSDLNFHQVSEAYKHCRSDHRRKQAPFPAEIRNMLHPIELDEDEAREAAARIIAGVSKFGWPNQTAAREFIGELGWCVVERQGGWQTICAELTDENVGMLQAQFRELAASMRRRAKIGIFNIPPRLIETKQPEGLTSLGDILSKALEYKAEKK